MSRTGDLTRKLDSKPLLLSGRRGRHGIDNALDQLVALILGPVAVLAVGRPKDAR